MISVWTISSNIGPLITPLDKYEYEAHAKPVPRNIGSHNSQTKVTQSLLDQYSPEGGVLARIGDALNSQEDDIFSAYSISGRPKVLQGSPVVRKPTDVLSGNGVESFHWQLSFAENIEAMSKTVATSIYGESFSASMSNAIHRTRFLEGTVGDASLSYDACFGSSQLKSQFRQVAKVIKARDLLEAKRDVFYVEHCCYDTHDDNGPRLEMLLKHLDEAIGCFTNEVKSQGVWNNVTIVTASEFGRTLTSNGKGTDHAWGANHWLAGGDVKGGQIHGQYPSDLTEDGPLRTERGSLIPTTPWEGLWNGLAEWFGVTSENIASLLPNLANFDHNIFNASDMFE
eukprot:scaffold1373_cov288-Alexandrium_tamarense.AAC.2